MFNTSSPELWFIDPPDYTSGFLFIATNTSDQLDIITNLLIENEYRLAASLSDDTSRFHVKDDCGVVYKFCISDENLPFIGGSIVPFISKQKLLGRLALPTFIFGIALLIVMSYLIIVMISATIAFYSGNIQLASNIGTAYQPLLQLLMILAPPFLLFSIPLVWKQRGYSTIMSRLKIEVKEVLLLIFPEYEVHDIETYTHLKSRKLPQLLCTLIDQFSESIPEVTHEQLKDYDISEYT